MRHTKRMKVTTSVLHPSVCVEAIPLALMSSAHMLCTPPASRKEVKILAGNQSYFQGLFHHVFRGLLGEYFHVSVNQSRLSLATTSSQAGILQQGYQGKAGTFFLSLAQIPSSLLSFTMLKLEHHCCI